ncbi:MAG: hypothetical protein LUD76_01810 [Alistipes sp.]|nr:hypothetical protein [Alistipes sp.]
MEKKNYFVLIDDYLACRLEDAAREDFERELAVNPELAVRTEQAALLEDAIVRKAESELFGETNLFGEAVRVGKAEPFGENGLSRATSGITPADPAGEAGRVGETEEFRDTGLIRETAGVTPADPAGEAGRVGETKLFEEAEPFGETAPSRATAGTMSADPAVTGEDIPEARKRSVSADNPGRKRYTVRKVITAVISAAAVWALLVWYGTGPKYDTVTLYAGIFDPSVYEPVPSRGWDGLTEAFPDGLAELLADAYFTGDYERVINLGAGLLRKPYNESTPDDYMLMMGASLLETDRLAEAREIARHIMGREQDLPSGDAPGRPTAVQDAEWIIVLTYLRGGDRRAAQETLEEVIARGGYYREQAAGLLSYLKARRWF